MIKTTAMFLEELREYGSPKSKLSCMAERGECFPITKGLYETDPNVPAHLLAGSIYGPTVFWRLCYKNFLNSLAVFSLKIVCQCIPKPL